MILKNYLDFWWRKPSGFTPNDDIRFVIMKYKCGHDKWQIKRISYSLVSRTGICWRLSRDHDWKFFGLLTMGDRKTVESEEDNV